MSRRSLATARCVALLCIAFVAVAPTFASAADDYPNRQIQIVVPYTPGGFNDTLARTLAERLNHAWNVPVVVENRPGGNTLIGNSYVARAAPDGYTLLITPLPFAALPALYGDRLPYAQTAFRPLVWAASTPNALVVRPGLGISSVAELIDFAKKNPGKLNYGSTGSGSSNHLSMELFMSMTGTKMTHVPYKGSAPAVLAMLAGDIDVLFDNVPNLIKQIKADKLKTLAVTGTGRAGLLPDVPTVEEAGVAGYEVLVWFGLQVPAGTPTPIVDKLNRAIVAIVHEPDVVRLFRDQGVDAVGSTPEAFASLLKREVPKWTKVVNDAGVRIE